MFKLNRLTDYAVVVMSQMANNEETVLAAPDIARLSSLPLPTVSKVLNSLSKAGLVTSQRGASGGYHLTREAMFITVADIIQALEGPIALTACVDGAGDSCDAESHCPMRGHWNQVNWAIRQALDSVTLEQMAQTALPLMPLDSAQPANQSAAQVLRGES